MVDDPNPPRQPPAPRQRPLWTRRGRGGGGLEPVGVGPQPKPSLAGGAAVDPAKAD